MDAEWERELSIADLERVAEDYVDALPIGMAKNERDAADRHQLFYSLSIAPSSNSIATRSLLEQIHAALYFNDRIEIKDDYGIFRFLKFSMPVFLSVGGVGYAAEQLRYITLILGDTSVRDSQRLFFNSVGNTAGD